MRRHSGASYYGYHQQDDTRVAQRNFLSHSEFPDDKFTASIRNQKASDNAGSGNGKMQQQSTKKAAKFKLFDPNTSPANFKKCNNNVNSQNVQNQKYQQKQQQQINYSTIDGQQFYSGQSQAIYQYIPPPEFSRHCTNMYSQNLTQFLPSATAVTPNGEKIFIPLDDSRYEIKRTDHDLYDMPEDCDLHVLSSEGPFESSVQLHSPRPIRVQGSLSDEWCCSSEEEPFTDTDSERETDLDTGTDTSELAIHFVTNALKTITEGVDNVLLQSNEDDTKVTEQPVPKEDTDSFPVEHTDTCLIPKKEPVINERVEKNEKMEKNERSSQDNTDNKLFQKCDSSSSESDIPKNSQIAKVEIKSKYFYATNRKADQLKNDTRNAKKQKDNKPRAWKENRKEKREKTTSHGKKERKTSLANECSSNVNEMKPETLGSLEAKSLINGTTEHVDNSRVQSVVDENVQIDGQYYFQSQQCSNDQHYYISDIVHLDRYQQYQYRDEPEYTMFIHDAYPPPSKDEVCEQVYKSMSGEVLNNQALAYQQQAADPRLCQQQNLEQFIQTPCNNYTGGNMEQIHCNTERIGLDQGTYYETVNGSSRNIWIRDQAQSTLQNVTFCKDERSSDQMSTGQGQLYISYNEDCVYVDPDNGLSFPALHMTDDFLVTVILRKGVFLEINANKVLRLVNHEKKLVVAINETGNKSCIIHPAARIYQSDTNVHTELFLGRRAKMTEELIMFGNKLKTYKFDHRMVMDMTEEPGFRDMSQDDSVSFLSTDGITGSDAMKLKMEEILAHAHFWKNGTCGSTTLINGTKIVQNEKGDVSVYCGPINFLRMNPEKMILRLKTRCIEIDIETNWNVKITRGSHALNASNMDFIVSNGKVKASLDSNNNLQSFSMPDYRVLMLGQPVSKHRHGVPGHRCRTLTQNTEPEGDHWSYIRRNTHHKQSCFREWEEGWDNDFDKKNCQKRWDPQAGRWVYPSRQWQWQ